MVETKVKEPTLKSEVPEKGTPTNSIPRLYTRCKAEIPVKEWGGFFLGMPEEVKKWFAFPNLGKGEVRRDPVSDQHSAEGSNKQPPKKEDGKNAQELAI